MTSSNEYKHSFERVITNMYGNMKSRSLSIYGAPIKFTRDEFVIWLMSQPEAYIIMLNWRLSGYTRKAKPSIDRIDDYGIYEFSNIQLVTYGYNHKKGMRDIFNGINSKGLRAVVGTNIKTGETVEFASANIASRSLNGVHQNNIIKVCKGKRKTAGGYNWQYKKEDYVN